MQSCIIERNVIHTQIGKIAFEGKQILKIEIWTASIKQAQCKVSKKNNN